MADETPVDALPVVEQTVTVPDQPEETPREPDWKVESRIHEKRSKAESKRADALTVQIEELKKADQSDQEKALDVARKEAREQALTEADADRRQDRLEVAVTRLSAKSFADTDDALANVERAVARGEIDPDDIFDKDGKVQTDALQTALNSLLESKPHLRAAGTRPSGDADAGKGAGPDSGGMNDLIRQGLR